MHIKNIHCMVEKLAECAKCEVEKGIEQLNTEEMGAVTDMLKDLCEAEYYAREAKEMEKEEEDEKKENEYFLKMLKEEYGEEEGEKRFYSGQPRSRTSGRFMRRGDGRRRGYEEPPYYHMSPEMYKEHDPEWYRDMDRVSGKMYYTPTSGGNSGGQSGSSMSGGNMSGNVGGSTRGYSDGFDDGQRRGYSEGYEQGNRDGRSQGGNSRYDRAKRGYEESKEKHKGNTPQDNSENMKNLEELLNSTGDVIVKDYAPKMSQSEKAMAAQKFDTWSKMLKQQ